MPFRNMSAQTLHVDGGLVILNLTIFKRLFQSD
jgi:hypothetical protein